jgi:hypothetical protein
MLDCKIIVVYREVDVLDCNMIKLSCETVMLGCQTVISS